jgi:tetratricopeptide (TPR) repeat protein
VYKCVIVSLLSLFAHAQISSLATIRGEVSREGEFPMVGYSIEWINPSNSSIDLRAPINSSGNFELAGVTPGNYRARIFKDNALVHSTWVTVRNDGSSVQIDLPQANAAARPASGTVSLHRLTHKVPKKAMKELNRSVDARQKGDIEKSLAHLEKAVEIDPEFTEAYVNLGARYMDMKRLDDAEDTFAHAIRLDPHCPEAHANLALVYVTKKMPKEAEISARKSLEINEGAPKAHFVLAYALALQDPRSAEALRHYERAGSLLPIARLGAAQIRMAMGDHTGAEKELKEYLKTGDQSNRALAQNFLARLQQ